jgi:hypothetical protein
MASEDPFMKAAVGHYPLSENTGAARYWTTDGLPHPDRPYLSLLVISILFGIIGIDHFWLRSPKTGFLKMLTFGGFGLWWLWDVVQLLTEKERVLNYGMTTPFDITTGIAQGMITDKKTNYQSKANYGIWAFTAIFSFLGFDSLFVMKNMGQGLRKLLEGGLVLASLVIVLTIATDGMPHGFFAWIGALIKVAFAVTCLTLFGTSVGVSWIKTLTKAMGPPETLMQEGIIFSAKDDKLVNAQVESMLLATTTADDINRDEKLKKIKSQIHMLKYGSILPQEFQSMFSVDHISNTTPEPPPSKEINENATNPTEAMAAYVTAPLTTAGNNMKEVGKELAVLVRDATIPGAAGLNMVINKGAKAVVSQMVTNPKVMKGVASSLMGMAPPIMRDTLGPIMGIDGNDKDGGIVGAVTGAAGQAVGAVTGAAEKAGQVVGAVTGAAEKAGQVVGAVTGAAEKAGQVVAGVTDAASAAVAGVTEAASEVANTVASGIAATPTPKVQRLATIMRDIRELVPGIGDTEIKQLASTLYKTNPDISRANLETLAKAYHAQQATHATLPESDAAYRAEQQMKEMARLPPPVMAGGARSEPLSIEGKLMGATTIALICGGAVKFIIDNLIPE